MSDPQDPQAAGQSTGEAAAQFSIQRIYVKDLSFETPNSPEIFQAEWRPDVDLQLHSNARRLAPDVYEVVVTITVTAKLDDKTAFLVEVHQAGIFGIQDVREQDMGPMLGSFCPTILFPYARETVSDLITRGGFPQILLAPVNFDALYAQHVHEAQKREAQPADRPH